jgi:hypothetical protein
MTGLEDIMLSEINQAQKVKYLHMKTKKVYFIEVEGRIVVTRG